MGAWSGTEQAQFSRVLKAFSAETGTAVRYTSAHGRVPGTLDARMAAGRIPDVVMLPQPGALRHYARAGLLVPLDAEAKRLVDKHYPAVWRELASYAGQEFGVWFKAANKSLIWYDISIFEGAGLVPPGDLGDLGRVAGILRDRGIAAFALAGGDGWTLTDWFENLTWRWPARTATTSSPRTGCVGPTRPSPGL
ncbi:MAG: alpha-glucoside transport system substrate-binding protein [Pseudonocardiales bacterium]|nr:alpha-glucoside transport system substrate-binding protein [Pseudonocardiales bacterium]